MKFKIFSFIVAISAYHAVVGEVKFISLIAPAAIISDQPYTAFLTTSHLNNTDMAITLRTETYYLHINERTKQAQPIIFDKAGIKSSADRGRNYNGQTGFPLKFLARQEEKCISKEIIILNTPRTFHTFIQLDKPIYKPNDEIKYRVLVLDHDTRPIAINNIKVEIKDNEGNIVEQQTELREQIFRIEGFFESTFKLSETINVGNWTISVTVNNNQRIFTEKKFKVESEKRPSFEVILNCEKEVFLTDKTFEVQIAGKYSFGEYIKGIARIVIKNNETGENLYEEFFRAETLELKKINIANDLGIKALLKDKLKLMIHLVMNDKSMGDIQSVDKVITLYNRRKHSIEIQKNYPFVNGFEFEFDVVIRDSRGHILSSSNEPVKLSYNIKRKNQNPINKEVLGKIQNSMAKFKIEPFEDMEEINVKIDFQGSEIEETFKPEPIKKGTLKVSVDPKFIANANQDIKLTVEHKDLQEVIVLAIGRKGIIFANDYNCYGENPCQLYLDGISQFFSKLKPEAKVVVYSIGENVLYGSALINFESLSESKLIIKVPPTGKPKQPINIELLSKKDSIVSILAIDKKSALFANGHDISREDVFNALTNNKKLAYARNEGMDVIFDRENNNFIVNLPLDKWRDCTASEIEVLSKVNDSDVLNRFKRSKHGGMYYEIDEEEEDFEEIDIPDDPVELDLRKEFTETWIWETNKLTDGDLLQMDVLIPDSMTTWLFTGFSIHKDYGLAIAKPQELVVSQEFFIELNLPHSIKYGEIFKLEVFAFNFLSQNYAGSLNTRIKVIAQHEDENQQFEFIKFLNILTSCETEAIAATSQVQMMTIPHQTGLREKFLIKPFNKQKIKIRVEAEATIIKNGNIKTLTDKIVKSLTVEHEGVPYFDTNHFEFKLNQTNELKIFSHSYETTNIMEDSIELTAVIIGDMMGASLNFYNGVFRLPTGDGADTMAIYGRTFWLYKYLKNIGKITSNQEIEAKNLLKGGFQHMMRFKRSDGGFAVFVDHPREQGLTWLAAYISSILGSAMQFGIEPINVDIIRNALNFCIQNQNPDGSFKETSNSRSPTFPEESKEFRAFRFTAFVLVSLLKNKDFVGLPFTEEIEKAFNYLESSFTFDNYGASVAAYAAVLAKRTYRSKFLFDFLERHSESDGETKYWNLNKGISTSPDTQVLISAYAAMVYIEGNQIERAEPIIRWLLRKRNPQGGFRDSHATAVAMEAFAMMAEKTGTSDTKITFEFLTGDGSEKREYVLTNENALKPHIIKMPKGTLNVTVKGQGKGYGRVTTYYEYSKNIRGVSNTFLLNVTTSLVAEGSTKIESCVERKEGKLLRDLVVMEFNLIDGYAYEARSDPMAQNRLIQNVETRRGGTVVELYFQEVPLGSPQCAFIYAKKAFYLFEQKKASVKVYEYYEKDATFASSFFNIGGSGCT